jgi:polygalacturonase
MKSGMNEDGWRVGKPTENVVVRYIRTAEGHGGAVLGSDMSGDIRNVYFSRCIYDGTDVGIRLKSTRGRGGVVEKVWFENIEMKNITREAIQISTTYRAWMGTTEGKAPLFRDISFQNINVEGARQSINIEGLPETPIQDICFKNVSIKAGETMNVTHLQKLELENVKVQK